MQGTARKAAPYTGLEWVSELESGDLDICFVARAGLVPELRASLLSTKPWTAEVPRR